MKKIYLIILFLTSFCGFSQTEEEVRKELEELFTNCKNTNPNDILLDIIAHNGNTYVLARKLSKENPMMGIIDKKEEILSPFEFEYEAIEQNTYTKDDIWFLTKKKGEEYSHFTSISGDTKTLFINKIKEKRLGYAIAESINNTMGVIDLTTMQWVIKPQKQLHFLDFRHTSKEEIDIQNIENRPKAMLYILVYQNDYQYFIDLKGKKYIPEKYLKE